MPPGPCFPNSGTERLVDDDNDDDDSVDDDINLYQQENYVAAAVLAQSVERVDCRAGGRGFNSWGRTSTQGLKITEK